MAGLGLTELAVLLGMMLFGSFAFFGGRSTKLVLQKLSIHEAVGGETSPVIELVGRQQGIISFLLTLLGVSPITDLRVTPEELCCNSTSLFGRQNQAVPLRAISSVAAGVRKPIGYLFMAFVLLIAGVFGGAVLLWREGLYKFLTSFFACGLFAALFIWLYAINKRFFVSVYTQGGPPVLLSLKPNVIEGVPLDLDRALQVVKVIRDRVIASTAPATGIPIHPAPVPSADGQQAAPAVHKSAEPTPTPTFVYDGEDYFTSPLVTESETLLQQARDLIKQKRRDEAISILRDIVMRFPTSAEANVARSTLQKAGIGV